MLVVRALYGLKSSGAAFRAFLVETSYDLNYQSSQADPNIWMRPAVEESNSIKYWEYVLCYVDDVLCLSERPEATMRGIQKKFKLKDDKMEKSDVYLGAELSTMDNL